MSKTIDDCQRRKNVTVPDAEAEPRAQAQDGDCGPAGATVSLGVARSRRGAAMIRRVRPDIER